MSRFRSTVKVWFGCLRGALAAVVLLLAHGALARDFPLPPRGDAIQATPTAPLAGTWIGEARAPDRTYRILLFHTSGTPLYDGTEYYNLRCVIVEPEGLEDSYCQSTFLDGNATTLKAQMLGEYGERQKGLFWASSAFGDLSLSLGGNETLSGTWTESNVSFTRLIPRLSRAEAIPVRIEDLEYHWRLFRENGGSWRGYQFSFFRVILTADDLPHARFVPGEIVVDDPHFELYRAYMNEEGKLQVDFRLHEGVEAGRKMLTVAGGATVPFNLVIVRPPEPPTLELLSLVDRQNQLVQAFGPARPARALVAGPQNESEHSPLYGLRFAVGPGPGSGTVVSSDPEVISLVRENFSDADAGADGAITRRFVAKSAGTAKITVTWTCCTGGAPMTLTDSFDVTVSPIDLSIVGVPDFAEEDAGGYVRVGSLAELNLSYPTDASTVRLVALAGGERIRLWADRARTRPLAMPLVLDAETGPRRLFVESLRASEHVRDISLRLSYAGLLFLGEWDTVALTAVVVGLAGDAVIGLNDDDDDLNDQKDYEQITVTSGDDDLRPLTVTVQPFVETFGRRTLDVSGGLSVWQSPDKTSGAPLVDALNNARAPVQLEGAELVQTFHMEGVTVLAPALIRLTLSPHINVGGRMITIGPALTETMQVSVVQADIDIVGVADVGNAEWITGGQVPIVDGEQPFIGDLTELRLHVRPGQAPVSAVRLAMPRGAEHVKLWRARGPEPGERDRLVPITLSGESRSAIIAHSDPWDSIYVQGLSDSGERGIELVMSIYSDVGATEFVHEDRVTLTVAGERPQGEALSLRPLFLILPQEITDPNDSPMTVLLKDGDDNTIADVSKDAETEYEWFGKGLNELIDLTDYPVAHLEMNEKGTLTVLSPGVQFVRARHGKLTSAPMLLLAGLQLDEIELGAISALRLPFAFAATKNPPLVLGRSDTLLANYGFVELTDLSFKALGRDDLTLSYSQLRRLLIRALAIQPQLAPEIGLLGVLLETGREVADRLVALESTDTDVAETSMIPGVVRGVNGGIAGIKGTLDLPFGLGSASDTVLTFVLPALDSVAVVAAGDEPGKHDAPILLRPVPGWNRADVHGVVSSEPIVRATVPFGKKLETYEKMLDAVLPGGTGGMLNGDFDLVISIPTLTDETELRFTGRLLKAAEAEQSAAVFENVVISFPLSGVVPQSWQIARSAAATGDGAALPATIPPSPGLAELWLPITPVEMLSGEAQVEVAVEIPGMGQARGSRPVIVEADQVAVCEAAPPILRLGGGSLPGQSDSIAALDDRFAQSGAPGGIIPSPTPFAASILRAAIGYGPIARLGAVEPQSPSAAAGWVYAVEVPVNDARSCDLHVQRSIAAGEGNEVRNIAQSNQRGRASLPYAIARYQVPVDGKQYALVYAGTFGWPAGPGESRKAGGLEERISVFDIGSGGYVATAVHALRVSAVGTVVPPRLLSQVLIGSSSGVVAPDYRPQTPDAAGQLRALPVLLVQ